MPEIQIIEIEKKNTNARFIDKKNYLHLKIISQFLLNIKSNISFAFHFKYRFLNHIQKKTKIQ